MQTFWHQVHVVGINTRVRVLNICTRSTPIIKQFLPVLKGLRHFLTDTSITLVLCTASRQGASKGRTGIIFSMSHTIYSRKGGLQRVSLSARLNHHFCQQQAFLFVVSWGVLYPDTAQCSCHYFLQSQLPSSSYLRPLQMLIIGA